MVRIIHFIKDWTLPVAIATGAIIYLFFAFIPALDKASVFFAPIFDEMLPLFMFLVLYVTFCKVDFRGLDLSYLKRFLHASSVPVQRLLQ